MSTRSRITPKRTFGLVLIALALIPEPASAHALFGDHDPDRPLWNYLTLGFGHMVGGWDHLLFIGGVVLLAGSLRTAAKLISLFVVGHSLTLLVATIAEWKLNATAVDVVIALSLVYVGAQGIRGRPDNLRLFGAIVFGFGLVHGLGLSTRLQDLGLPDDGIVARVVLFNIGVELGQLIALAAIVGIGTLVVRGLSNESRRKVATYAFGGLILSGLIAAAVMTFPNATDEDDTEQVAADAESASGCTQTDSQPPQFIGGGHPAKLFFAPDETAPEADLVHVIGDGLLIVRYRPDLAPAEVDEIEEFVSDPASDERVIAAPDPAQPEPLRAVAALRTLTCTEVEVEGLETFRDDWLTFVQSQQP